MLSCCWCCCESKCESNVIFSIFFAGGKREKVNRSMCTNSRSAWSRQAPPQEVRQMTFSEKSRTFMHFAKKSATPNMDVYMPINYSLNLITFEKFKCVRDCKVVRLYIDWIPRASRVHTRGWSLRVEKVAKVQTDGDPTVKLSPPTDMTCLTEGLMRTLCSATTQVRDTAQ